MHPDQTQVSALVHRCVLLHTCQVGGNQAAEGRRPVALGHQVCRVAESHCLQASLLCSYEFCLTVSPSRQPVTALADAIRTAVEEKVNLNRTACWPRVMAESCSLLQFLCAASKLTRKQLPAAVSRICKHEIQHERASCKNIGRSTARRKAHCGWEVVHQRDVILHVEHQADDWRRLHSTLVFTSCQSARLSMQQHMTCVRACVHPFGQTTSW